MKTPPAIIKSFSYDLFFLIMSSELTAHACGPKYIANGAHVSGTFGEFYAIPNPNMKRRKQQRMYSFALAAVEHSKYCVQFDDGIMKECFSNTLHIETVSASLPPPKRQELISWQCKQQEREGGREGQTDSEVVEDKNI